MDFFPLWVRETEKRPKVNWVAILSIPASLIYSVAIWTGIIRAVAHLAR
jgi:hypothetical protein